MTKEHWLRLKEMISERLQTERSVLFPIAALRTLLDCPSVTRKAIERFHATDDEAFGLRDASGTSASTGKSPRVIVLEFYRR